MKTNTIPTRKEVPAEYTWDLTSLYENDSQWEQSLEKILALANQLVALKGTLAKDTKKLLQALQINAEMEQISELAGNYAFLLTAQDAGDADSQNKMGRYMMTASQAEAETSFFVPELQTLSDSYVEKILQLPEFSDYAVFLQKLFRLKPYILSEKEEKLFALQSESMETASKAFGMLTNVDIDYGTVKTAEGEKALSQTTWSSFMLNPNREIRKEAYNKFYKAFDSHKNTIATLYTGSVNQDVYMARARGYSSSLEKALFPDKVPLSVYENLVSTVRENLAPLHKYYSIMKKVLKVDELRHYDVYVPLVETATKNTTYEEAVEIIRNALSPLGTEYTNTLCNGLLGGWVDRYENKGKRSGAFSSGCFTGYPYILMNYKDDVIRDVFTLAHEGGHSMHSWYAAKSNPFMNYNYTIFEAEVASTFNEQLVFEYLMKNTSDPKMKAYLLDTRIGDILATLYRQTMFAEYEKITHDLVENGTPLSVDVCRKEYRKLLETYFGPEMIFEEESDLECLRIPHFYNAFYVYKYATGISASLALANRVTKGGKQEKEDYFSFLKSGGSRYPIEALNVAGVDMESPKAIKEALLTFSQMVDQLEGLI